MDLLKFHVLIFNNILNYLNNNTLLNIRLLNKDYLLMFNKCNLHLTFNYNTVIINRNLDEDTKFENIHSTVNSLNNKFNSNQNKNPNLYFNLTFSDLCDIYDNIIEYSKCHIDGYHKNFWKKFLHFIDNLIVNMKYLNNISLHTIGQKVIIFTPDMIKSIYHIISKHQHNYVKTISIELKYLTPEFFNCIKKYLQLVDIELIINLDCISDRFINSMMIDKLYPKIKRLTFNFEMEIIEINNNDALGLKLFKYVEKVVFGEYTECYNNQINLILQNFNYLKYLDIIMLDTLGDISVNILNKLETLIIHIDHYNEIIINNICLDKLKYLFITDRESIKINNINRDVFPILEEIFVNNCKIKIYPNI